MVSFWQLKIITIYYTYRRHQNKIIRSLFVINILSNFQLEFYGTMETNIGLGHEGFCTKAFVFRTGVEVFSYLIKSRTKRLKEHV